MAHHQVGLKKSGSNRSSIQKMGHKTGTTKCFLRNIKHLSSSSRLKRRSCRIFGGISMMGRMKTLPFIDHVSPLQSQFVACFSGDAFKNGCEQSLARSRNPITLRWSLSCTTVSTDCSEENHQVSAHQIKHHHARTSTSIRISYNQCQNIAEP